MNSLAGKTILITAAAQGMGRASALACAAQGARVFATDINDAGLATLAAENSTIETHHLDVTDNTAILALAEKLPPLDGLFNCAGMVHHGTVMDISEEDWEINVNLNLTSMVRTCRAFLPGLQEQARNNGTASIVNMSSMASSIKGFVNRAAYGVTKAGILGLTKSIAIDYVGEGIRCNAVCPGTVDTPSLRERIEQAPDPVQAEKDFIARQPIGRLAVVDDITPLVVYLLSDDSQYVTGQPMLVDGGVTI